MPIRPSRAVPGPDERSIALPASGLAPSPQPSPPQAGERGQLGVTPDTSAKPLPLAIQNLLPLPHKRGGEGWGEGARPTVTAAFRTPLQQGPRCSGKTPHSFVQAAALLVATALAACSSQPSNPLPSLQLEPQPFDIRIAARGELRAAQSTPINVPNVVMGPQVLTWIAPEGEPVDAGEVIARFDGTQFRTERDKAAIELAKVGLNRDAKSRELQLELSGVAGNRELVTQELLLSQRFASADQRLYSRNEILDMLQDQAYLASQSRYFDWKSAQSEQRSGAEIALLDTQAGRHRMRLEQNEANLSRLELTAPHAGTLIYARNWWGESPAAGQSVFPGMKLAELPDASAMEARLHVLESEAGGLAVEQAVELRLDAEPGRRFQGRIKSIGQVASARERDSPVKYFEFIVRLDETDTRVMRSGSTVSAVVAVAGVDAALAVPNQALYGDAEGHWVYVLDRRGQAERRTVKPGLRSGTRTEIVEGLRAGERIALARPTGVDA